MNKHLKHIMCGAFAVGLLASCTQKSKTFVVEGFVDEAITDSAYQVYIGDENFNISMREPVDVIVVKDKKFHYECNVDYPTFIFFRAIFPGDILCNAYVDAVLVPGETAKITVHNGYYDIKGTKFYEDWNGFDKFYDQNFVRVNELRDQLRGKETIDQEVYKEYMAACDSLQEKLIGYVKQHKADEGAVIYASTRGIVSDSVLFDSIAAPKIKNGMFSKYVERQLKSQAEYAKYRAEVAEKQKATAIGAMYKDFAAEYNGKITKLSDFVGKGKYVLVDFWASWCGPCRAETPNLISAYDKFKGDKFNVLGVTVSDRPEDSERAMEELGINYPQMLNAPDSCANLYGINGIPHIILFGPDGTILERDLRGEEIEIAVKKYLGL